MEFNNIEASVNIVHTCMRLLDERVTKETIKEFLNGSAVTISIHHALLIKAFYDMYILAQCDDEGSDDEYNLLKRLCEIFGERTGTDKSIYINRQKGATNLEIAGALCICNKAATDEIDQVSLIYDLIVRNELGREYSPAIAYLLMVIMLESYSLGTLVFKDEQIETLCKNWLTDDCDYSKLLPSMIKDSLGIKED